MMPTKTLPMGPDAMETFNRQAWAQMLIWPRLNDVLDKVCMIVIGGF